jgi:hypothetical protein
MGNLYTFATLAPIPEDPNSPLKEVELNFSVKKNVEYPKYKLEMTLTRKPRTLEISYSGMRMAGQIFTFNYSYDYDSNDHYVKHCFYTATNLCDKLKELSDYVKDFTLGVIDELPEGFELI